MIDLRKFILKGLKKMIGFEPEYKIIKFALGWYDKGVILSEDLEMLDTLLEENA